MKKSIQTFVISDCYDYNAQARYVAGFSRHIGGPINTYGIQGLYEGAGITMDIIDTLGGAEAIVFLNVAPRRDKDKDDNHKNGRPFYYFFIRETLVICSSEDGIFSFFSHMGIPFEEIRAIDFDQIPNIPTHTQFRSAQCVPAAAALILNKTFIGKEVLSDITISDVPPQIWFVDNFGNCKTTLLTHDSLSSLPGYTSMNDVRDGEAAQIIGSSGYADNRLVELTIKGASYAATYDKKIGNQI